MPASRIEHNKLRPPETGSGDIQWDYWDKIKAGYESHRACAYCAGRTDEGHKTWCRAPQEDPT